MPIYKTDAKKNGLQGYRVEVNYTNSNGEHKKRVKRVYGLQNAKEVEKELANAEEKANSTYTFDDLYKDYFKNKEVRKATIAHQQSLFSTYIIPYFQNTKLKNLSKKTLQNWKNIIQEKDLEISTKQYIYKMLSAILNWAVKMEYLNKNLLKDLGNFKEVYFKASEEKLRYYTAEQYKLYEKAMLKYCTTLKEQRYYVFFSIAFYTGMRKGEINALRWTDIEDHTIHIRRSVNQRVKGNAEETPPKTKSSYRSLQMPEPLYAILENYKTEIKKFADFSEDWKVCGGTKYLPEAAIRKYNLKFAELANLPSITIHEFRHTHASILCNAGINIQEIARRLGHSNVNITWKIYAHLYPQEEERAIEIFNKI